MEVFLGIIILVLAVALFEYRFRKPDNIVVYETRSGVGVRKARLYARHFGTPLSRTAHAFTQTVDASAKGNLDIRVKLAVAVAPADGHLDALVRAGGWSLDAVARAARELETFLLGQIKAFTEQYGIEELSSEKIRTHLLQQSTACRGTLGLEIVTLTVVSFEPTDPRIAEAVRQQEQARILEQTESLNHQARIAAARVRSKADEEIDALDHTLALKRMALRQEQLEREMGLASTRAAHELRLKQMHLDHEKEELRLLKESPELLLLTPQAARLAEASQTMKNARTVVNLASAEGAQGGELLGLFHTLVQGALEALQKRKKG